MSLTDPTADDEDDFKEVSEVEFQKVQSKTTKMGYVDGIAAGREVVFQNAFDKGYADGLRTGFEMEKFRAFFKNLTTEHSEELHKESAKYNELQIEETTSKSHSQFLKHKGENISEISKAQQTYVDDILGQYQRNLPQTANLLASQQKR